MLFNAPDELVLSPVDSKSCEPLNDEFMPGFKVRELDLTILGELTYWLPIGGKKLLAEPDPSLSCGT